MIFLFFGVALLGVELFGLGGSARDIPVWFRWGLPILLLAIAWYRRPRDRFPWTLVAAGLLLQYNKNAIPFGWLASALIVGTGAYLVAYGWQSRRVDRGERWWFLTMVVSILLAYLVGLFLLHRLP